jgi:hypothetical protein
VSCAASSITWCTVAMPKSMPLSLSNVERIDQEAALYRSRPSVHA